MKNDQKDVPERSIININGSGPCFLPMVHYNRIKPGSKREIEQGISIEMRLSMAFRALATEE